VSHYIYCTFYTLNTKLPSIESSEKSDIIEKAKIYGRISDKPLTKYQSAVNDAATAIARENPMLVLNKGTLFSIVS
jgi:hypothetical protein